MATLKVLHIALEALASFDISDFCKWYGAKSGVNLKAHKHYAFCMNMHFQISAEYGDSLIYAHVCAFSDRISLESDEFLAGYA